MTRAMAMNKILLVSLLLGIGSLVAGPEVSAQSAVDPGSYDRATGQIMVIEDFDPSRGTVTLGGVTYSLDDKLRFSRRGQENDRNTRNMGWPEWLSVGAEVVVEMEAGQIAEIFHWETEK